MTSIGPSTSLPLEMVREHVLLCLGEETTEFLHAVDETGLPPAVASHRYRAFHAEVRDEILCIAGAVGSAVVEKCMYELLRTGLVRRIVLVGTAGAMPNCTAPPMHALEVGPAYSVYQNFDGPPGLGWTPSMATGLPATPGISSDRFYGFSPLVDGDYPGEPGLLEAWHRHAELDAIVDMEVAAFYFYAQMFGRPDLQYAAVKVVANDVAELDALPDASAEALRIAIAAALPVLRPD